MTTYTLSDLATRVLKDLGIVGSEETPSDDDQAWAEETVSSEVQMLADIGLPIWNGSEMAVPQSYLTTLSRRIGLAVAPSYGLADLATAQMAMREAERSLAIMAAPRGARPLALRTDDSGRSAGRFSFTLGR